MSTWQERVWPPEDHLQRGVTASHRDAREIARRRRERKRRERIYPLLWAIGIFAWIYLTLWIAFGS